MGRAAVLLIFNGRVAGMSGLVRSASPGVRTINVKRVESGTSYLRR